MRLCGTEGLESALVLPRRAEYRTPMLPVVVSGPTTCLGGCNSNPGSSLPDGARAAIANYSPRPCYYRIDPRRLFCREAWQPVCAEVVAAARSKDEDVVLVIEADALSSDVPQALLSCPGGGATALGVGDDVSGGDSGRGSDGVSGGVGGSVRVRVGDGVSDGGRNSVSGGVYVSGGVSDSAGVRVSAGVSEGGRERRGWLGTDQAVWGLAMLRRILAEEGGSGRVAGVLLTERLADVGDSTVSIDARAALLLSVFSWAQLCLAEAIAREELEEAGGGKFLGEMGIADEATVMVAEHSESGTKLPDEGPVNAPDRAEDRQKVVPAVEVEDVAGVASDNGGRTNVAHAVEANVAGGVSDVVDAEGGSLREDTAAGEAAILGDAPSEPDKRENSNTMIRALALLEMIGRGVRVVFAPEGRVRFAIDCSIGVISTGLGILRRCVVRGGGGEGGSRQVLVYDTDDEESYRWLAAQVGGLESGRFPCASECSGACVAVLLGPCAVWFLRGLTEGYICELSHYH